MAAPSSYADAIRRLAPDHDPRHVEAFMRLEIGTLDSLDASGFAAAVRLASLCVDEAPEHAEPLAQSFGL